MNVMRIYAAARGALADRSFITKCAKKGCSAFEENYYRRLVEISGPSTHNPKQILKSWNRAYKHQVERYNWISEIQKPFKSKGTIFTRTWDRLRHK